MSVIINGTTGITTPADKFAGSSSGAVTVQPATVAGTWTMTLPTTPGTNSYLLQTDGTGITAWVAPSAAMVYPGAGIAVSTGTAWGTSLTAPSSAIVGISDTQTLTNKWVQPRVLASTANSAVPTLNTDNYDMMVITGQSVAITSFTTNLTGTPVNGQKLWISITGTTAIAITWGAKFTSSTVTLPTTTVTTNRLDVGFVWNVASTTWLCVATA